MAKKEKPSVDKIVKRVSKEFDKTTDRVEAMVSEAMKRFNAEVDRRLKELHELQDSLMERFGVAPTSRGDKDSKTTEKSGTTTATAKKASTAAAKPAAKPAAKTASKAKTATSKPAAKKPAAKKPSAPKPAAKAAGAKSTAIGKAAKTAPLNRSDLKMVKGIGPATEKKMKEAGITTIDQIANPSAEEQEKLKAFAKVRGSESWTAEAKKLL
ncbi:MAG: hypothetical protein R3280_05665 [Marinobacter sp.]|uniref:helix-hairpin-helix domain-containing protein n=1 Tax=Marinobacter sp. TaxID=50741 RepID=UPI00299D81CA|nr:helix-hairpin-helix domain-containing protein [Marinobacter sp.]MDX1634100.1 hypothetical protein [Marinobacter sp.]